MLDSNPATTPGLLGQMLSHLDGEPLSDATLYRSTALYPMAFRCSSPPRWIFMDILMPIGHLVQMMKNHGGYGIFLGPNLIIWIQYVLQELCLSSSSSPLLWCDNKSAAHLAANPSSMLGPNTLKWKFTLYEIMFFVNDSSFDVFLPPSSSTFSLNIFQAPSSLVSKRSFLLFPPCELAGDDRRYLANQQESNCLGSTATNRDRCNKPWSTTTKQSVKNVLKKEVS
ncbi:hypothetical protein AAG906_011561 [Vitis piasezkii]